MPELCLLLFLSASTVLAGSELVRSVTSQAERVGNQPIPGFQRGYLFFFEHAAVRLYSPEGYLAFVAVVQAPGIADPMAEGLAVDSDGSVAISIAYRNFGGVAGGIVFLDRIGQPAGFIDTGVYVPSNLCYGEDHALWSFGSQPRGRGDYMMLRRYSRSQKEDGRFLARSLFPAGLEPGSASWQSMPIAVGHDKVGLLAWSGKISSQAEWVEVDLKGTLLRRVPIDNQHDYGMAYTADGHLYRQKQGGDRLLVLDQNTTEWKDAGPSPGPYLWGTDGNELVFSDRGIGPINLRWFHQPQTP